MKKKLGYDQNYKYKIEMIVKDKMKRFVKLKEKEKNAKIQNARQNRSEL